MDHVTLTSSERLAETVDDKANKSWFRPNIFSQREKEEESGNGTWLCWPTRIPEVSSWPAIDEVPLETGPFSLENISANWLALIQSFRALFFWHFFWVRRIDSRLWPFWRKMPSFNWPVDSALWCVSKLVISPCVKVAALQVTPLVRNISLFFSCGSHCID